MHQDLLRLSVASASNDHRLGANEAPPAIISIFLGDQLTDIFEQMLNGKGGSGRKAGVLELGVPVLPPLPKHAGDRNRTSPFAFTGNKFEFRAVGSSQSISFPATVLNTIVADAIDAMMDAVEAKMKKKMSFEQAALETIKETYAAHKRIVFNGDNYSAAWHKEAAKRGLLNLKTAVDAIEHFTDQKNIELFTRLGVLNEREIRARQEVMYDIYFKQVNIEGETTEWIAQTQILPGALSYLAELSEIEVKSRAVERTIKQIVEATDALSDALEKLKAQNAELGGDEVHEKAHHMRDNVLPAMAEVRKAADALERILADKYWPLPSYREMLFVK
jgi:glutamine synthetase